MERDYRTFIKDPFLYNPLVVRQMPIPITLQFARDLCFNLTQYERLI